MVGVSPTIFIGVDAICKAAGKATSNGAVAGRNGQSHPCSSHNLYQTANTMLNKVGFF